MYSQKMANGCVGVKGHVGMAGGHIAGAGKMVSCWFGGGVVRGAGKCCGAGSGGNRRTVWYVEGPSGVIVVKIEVRVDAIGIDR